MSNRHIFLEKNIIVYLFILFKRFNSTRTLNKAVVLAFHGPFNCLFEIPVYFTTTVKKLFQLKLL